MKRLIHLFIAAAVVAASPPSLAETEIRVATFNVSLNRSKAGELIDDLRAGNEQARDVARILQAVRPDIVLLNEFDFDEAGEAIRLFQTNYLESETDGSQPLILPHVYSAPVNTGVASGLDLNRDGQTDGPADAWGFGRYPGQYGMVVLSRFPIERVGVRTFQKFLWKDLPNAAAPVNPDDGTSWYPSETWNKLRLSSKSHWDVPISIGSRTLHVLASHPTPPAFDGPEDRNGRRNHDEIRFWAEYISGEEKPWLKDDGGRSGGLGVGQSFVILGDQNADPIDGASYQNAIQQLLKHPAVNNDFTPSSDEGVSAAKQQAGANQNHKGNPAHDTGDFSDKVVGNLRADYVLPSRTIEVTDGGVFWPTAAQPLAHTIKCSDHRLVWLTLRLP